MCCAIVFFTDNIELGGHNPLKHFGQPFAPRVVVAIARIGSRHVIGRCVGIYATLRPAFARDQLAGIVFWVYPQLSHDGPLIADQPFVIDLVILCVAVGDDPVVQFFAVGAP